MNEVPRAATRASEAVLMLKNAHQAYELALLEFTPEEFPSPQDVVDWSNGTWDERGYSFCTKNFYYELVWPDLYAYRSNNIGENCSGSSDNLYEIDYGCPELGGDVQCVAYTDVGYSVCKGLVSQGFELVDARE